MKLVSTLASLAFAILPLSLTLGASGCAADATVEEEADDEVSAASSEDLTARARAYVGAYAWSSGTSSFVDWKQLTLAKDGTYTAEVDSSFVDPNVVCIAFPCTLAETGKWNVFRSGGRNRLLVRPAGGKAWRYYQVAKTNDGLRLTRGGATTTLATKAPGASCAAMLCAANTICVEGPNGGECQPIDKPTCAATTCLFGHTCVEGPNGAECQAPTTPCVRTGCSGQICADDHRVSTCEYRPEYACYQQATCERQANGQCGFTPSTQLSSCLASAGQ